VLFLAFLGGRAALRLGGAGGTEAAAAARDAVLAAGGEVADNELAVGVARHEVVRELASVARQGRQLDRLPAVVVGVRGRPLGRQRLLAPRTIHGDEGRHDQQNGPQRAQAERRQRR